MNITTNSRYLRSTTLRLERALTLLEQHEQQHADSIDAQQQGKKDSRSIATSLPHGPPATSETDNPVDAEVVDWIGDDFVSRKESSPLGRGRRPMAA
jgi:hypothetical protein